MGGEVPPGTFQRREHHRPRNRQGEQRLPYCLRLTTPLKDTKGGAWPAEPVLFRSCSRGPDPWPPESGRGAGWGAAPGLEGTRMARGTRPQLPKPAATSRSCPRSREPVC